MRERDAAAVDDLIRDTAQQVIMPRFRHLTDSDIREKAPRDYVTIADTEAEIALSEGLTAIIPGSVVVGEEAVSRHHGDLGMLDAAGPVWLVDPIDGTINFVEGVACFAVMVALIEDGVTVAGWIYDPVAGWMAHASRGGGAWRDGRRLAVAAQTPGPDRKRRANRQFVRKIGDRLPPGIECFTYRCAGQEYVALASGAADYSLYTRLMPWDHAAGALLHHEAGGIGKLLDGRGYGARVTSGVVLLTPDPESWDGFSQLLTA